MNWNTRYVSIENIIAKAYRDLGIADQINFGDAVEWAGDAMEMIGAPMSLIEKVETVDVVNYRAQVPCDLHIITTVAGAVLDAIDPESCDDKSINFTPMRYSTDAFHHYFCKGSTDHMCESDLTYKVNDNFFFANFETGKLLVSYKGMPVDDKGFPRIPDDPKFKAAVSGEIKWRLGFIRWSQGKMPQGVYQKLEQDRDWYIGAAQTRGAMPSPDMAESIKNNWLRLIPKINQHADGFKSAGSSEKRYNHNSGSSESRQGNITNDGSETYFNIQTND